jgi:hypothetical protein
MAGDRAAYAVCYLRARNLGITSSESITRAPESFDVSFDILRVISI